MLGRATETPANIMINVDDVLQGPFPADMKFTNLAADRLREMWAGPRKGRKYDE